MIEFIPVRCDAHATYDPRCSSCAQLTDDANRNTDSKEWA